MKKLFIIILTILFASCGFNTPVKDWFKEYTETAEIEKHELELTDYPIDKNGFTCVPSSDNTFVKFYMRNPQQYIIDFDYELDDSKTQSISKIDDSFLVLNQDSEDLTIMKMQLSEEFLVQTEGGGDLSNMISLTEPKSNRKFTPYHFNLKCNSIPEAVRNLTVIQDNSNNTYVLAMNMPDMSGIHRDISKIIIDNVEYPIVLSQNPSNEDIGINITDKWTTTYNSNWGSGANGASFSGKNSDRAVYFLTNKPFQTEELFFSVILEDKDGLKIESKVSDHSKKLNVVTINPEDLSTLETNEDGYSVVTLTAPKTTTEDDSVSDVTIYYKVYDANGKVKKQGSGIDKVDVNISTGKWTIETWAHKVGYIDSDEQKNEVSASGYIYVKPSYEGEYYDGGLSHPYKTFEEALSYAKESGIEYLRVILLEDVELKNDLIIDNFDIEVKASGNFKLKGNIFIENNHYLLINSNVTFDNIHLKKDSLIKCINIPAKAEYVATVFYDDEMNLEIEDKKIIEGKDSLLSENVVDRFVLQNSGYYITEENGFGVIKIAGIEIKTETVKGNYTVKLSGFDITDNLYSAKSGDTISVVSIKDIEGNSIPIDRDLKIDILLDGEVIQSATTNTITLERYKFVGLYKYILRVEFTHLDTKLVAQTLFTKID